MPAIRPKRPAPRQKVVHVAGDPDGDASHAARQSPLVPRLDDEVNVVLLNGEVEEAENRRVAPGRVGIAFDVLPDEGADI